MALSVSVWLRVGSDMVSWGEPKNTPRLTAGGPMTIRLNGETT